MSAWRRADPPTWVLIAVALAVLLVPGGIPMTIVGLPAYVRHRNRR